MANEIKYDSTQPVRSQQPATYTPTGLNDQNNLNAYNDRSMQQLQNVYNTAQQNTNAALKTAYDQNMSIAQAARDKITPQYQQAQNQLAAQNEVQRRNLNMQGAANGLNTGAGSQLALGQSMAYQRNAGNLARSEQEALGQADRGIADLQMNYQNAIAEATANNNYKLAAAMLDEYQNQYNRQMTLENQNYQREQQAEQQAYQRAFNEENRDYERRMNEENREYTRGWNENERDYERTMSEAQQRANFGDFSAYEKIFNKETADAMELMWSLQNPDAAWAAGKLKAEDYFALTGRMPSQPSASNAIGVYTGAAAPSAGTTGSSLPSFGGINPATGMPYRVGDISTGSWYGGSEGGRLYSNGYGGSSYGSRRSGSRSGSGGYTGPAGYYDTAGNFVVPDANGNVAQAYGSKLSQAGVGARDINAYNNAVAAAGGSSSSALAATTNDSGNSWGRDSDNTNNTNPLVSLYNNTLGKVLGTI